MQAAEKIGGVIFSDPDDEGRIVAELSRRAPGLPDWQLLELKVIAIWSAQWLRREKKFVRARRFFKLARVCGNLLTASPEEP
jgi:hypothetical protein